MARLASAVRASKSIGQDVVIVRLTNRARSTEFPQDSVTQVPNIRDHAIAVKGSNTATFLFGDSNALNDREGGRL